MIGAIFFFGIMCVTALVAEDLPSTIAACVSAGATVSSIYFWVATHK